jgi:hypothetical protein
MARYKRIYDGERRTVHKSLKLTPSEAAELGAAIARRGAMWSDFLRQSAFRCLGAGPPAAATQSNAELIDALMAAAKAYSPIGNNMNQISRHKNMTGELGAFTADSREALRAYREVADMHKAALAQLTTG